MNNLPRWLEDWRPESGFTIAQWDALGAVADEAIDALRNDPTGARQREFARRYGYQALDALLYE